MVWLKIVYANIFAFQRLLINSSWEVTNKPPLITYSTFLQDYFPFCSQQKFHHHHPHLFPSYVNSDWVIPPKKWNSPNSLRSGTNVNLPHPNNIHTHTYTKIRCPSIAPKIQYIHYRKQPLVEGGARISQMCALGILHVSHTKQGDCCCPFAARYTD